MDNYKKDIQRNEYWYDEQGNLIHYKNNQGREYWQEYNDKRNIIHFKDNKEFEYWVDYDKRGKLIHYKNSDGLERWYDNQGNIIKEKST